MRRASRAPLDELCAAARAAGWWVELAADPARSPRGAGTLTQLQIRDRHNPSHMKFVRLGGRNAIQDAAVVLAREFAGPDDTLAAA